MAGRVVVVGSINVDLVVAADHLPRPGETVLGGRFEQHFGGKGANQAVAAARAGAEVVMIGAVGNDPYGITSLQALEGEGIDVTHVPRVSEPTGIAIIAVDASGENQIVVASGANARVDAAAIDDVLSGTERTVVVAGFEVPLEAATGAMRAARQQGVMSVLNPAPAVPLSSEVLALGAIIVLNEQELDVAVGQSHLEEPIEALASRSSGPVIVTRGAAGAVWVADEERREFPAFPVERVVDTTGAGDAFVGVLAAWLAAEEPLEEAVVAANAGGALSVQREGAREGMPRFEELTAFLATLR